MRKLPTNYWTLLVQSTNKQIELERGLLRTGNFSYNPKYVAKLYTYTIADKHITLTEITRKKDVGIMNQYLIDAAEIISSPLSKIIA